MTQSASFRRMVPAFGLAALGVALALVSVVPPRDDRAVVAVSRIGDGVRLLPTGLSLSFLPLERRVLLPREDGAAIIGATVTWPLSGGGGIPVLLGLQLDGAGSLPVSAAEIRRVGWQGAWGAWLSEHLAFTSAETDALLRCSPLWREIFGDGAAKAPDPGPRLTALFAPLRLRNATITLGGADEFIRAVARRDVARVAPRTGRLVVLGLDALDWSLVDDLTRRGLMPNLSRLLRRGAQAVEDVPAPLISPVVWTTLATGVPPERHGVLDFLEPDPDGGPPHPVSSNSRRAPAIWEMAAAAGRSTAVIGWWATFPAQAPSGGAVYSDRLTEQLLGLSAVTSGLADPPVAEAAARQLALRASEVTPAMLAPFATVSAEQLAAARADKVGWDDPVGGLTKLVASTTTVERLTARELDQGTDLILAYLEGTDTVGHLFAAFRPPAAPGVDPALARRFAAVVDRYHMEVDNWIGRVADRLSPADTLVVVSDHGFTWGADRPRVPSGAHTATAVWWHRPEGVFIAAGPRVRSAVTRRRLSAIDVAPALLALAGLPAGAELPGKVPDWLLRPGTTQTLKVDWAALTPVRAPAHVALPPEARAEELAKLRALGYLAGGETVGSVETTPASTEGSPLPAPEPAANLGARSDRAAARRLNNLGTSRAAAGEAASAEAAYRDAILADPAYAAPHYNLSLLLRKQGRLDDADAEFWLAVEAGIADRELAVVRLALAYQQGGMAEKAREIFAEGRRRFPDSATIWLNSGVFLGERGDLQQARECLERAISLAPSNPAAHRNLAAALLGLGEPEQARHELEECLRLDPEQPEVRRQLAALAARQQR